MGHMVLEKVFLFCGVLFNSVVEPDNLYFVSSHYYGFFIAYSHEL